MNIVKCVINLGQSIRKNVIREFDEDYTSLHSQKMGSIPDSKDKDSSKSFFEKITIKLKWLLHPVRNTIANSNLYQRWYLFGWVMLMSGFIPAFVSYIFLLTAYSYSQLSQDYALLIFVRIVTWFKCTLWLAIFCFAVGFLIEMLSIWKEKKKELIIIFSIIGTIASFVSSYLARWIVIDITKLEPTSSSRSLIIFTIAGVVVFWLCLIVLVLFLVYCLTLFIPMFSLVGLFNTLYFSLMKNQAWYKFLLRKPRDYNVKIKPQKVWTNLALSRAGGAISLAIFFILPILNPIISTVYENTLSTTYTSPTDNLSSWKNLAENIIVYADYRPEHKVSECNNLKQGDWGLLIGYKKISIAHPEKSGGYTFKTQTCLFEDDALNEN